jgi:hypothetical protein
VVERGMGMLRKKEKEIVDKSGSRERYEVFELTISRSDPKVSCYWISCEVIFHEGR